MTLIEKVEGIIFLIGIGLVDNNTKPNLSLYASSSTQPHKILYDKK